MSNDRAGRPETERSGVLPVARHLVSQAAANSSGIVAIIPKSENTQASRMEGCKEAHKNLVRAHREPPLALTFALEPHILLGGEVSADMSLLMQEAGIAREMPIAAVRAQLLLHRTVAVVTGERSSDVAAERVKEKAILAGVRTEADRSVTALRAWLKHLAALLPEAKEKHMKAMQLPRLPMARHYSGIVTAYPVAPGDATERCCDELFVCAIPLPQGAMLDTTGGHSCVGALFLINGVTSEVIGDVAWVPDLADSLALVLVAGDDRSGDTPMEWTALLVRGHEEE